MEIEHFAINVDDPRAMTTWYETHLGMQTVRKIDAAPYTHFLADSSGRSVLEIYRNPPDDVPNYADLHPLQLHLAFNSTDPVADMNRLIEAGASLFEDQTLEDGSRLIMLRDPWGLALQLCHRARPLLER